MLFVITQDTTFGAPTAAYCKQVRTQNGLTRMPVLYDPDGAALALLGLGSPNHWHVVLSEGAVIEGKIKYGDAQAHQLVESLLTAP